MVKSVCISKWGIQDSDSSSVALNHRTLLGGIVYSRERHLIPGERVLGQMVGLLGSLKTEPYV